MINRQNINQFYAWINGDQWSSYVKGNRLFLLHSFTHQQFTLQKINYSQPIYEALKARTAYTLPHTPRVILSHHQPSKGYLYALVERADENFVDYVERIWDCIVALELLKNLLTVVMALCKRHGFFRIRRNMVKVSNLGFFIIWINQLEESFERQFPLDSDNILQNCKIMTLDLIQLFMETHHGQSFGFLLAKVNKSTGLTFENVQYIINQDIKKRKVSPESNAKNNILDIFRKTGLNPTNKKNICTLKKTLSSEQHEVKNYSSHLNLASFKNQIEKIGPQRTDEQKKKISSKNIDAFHSTPQTPVLRKKTLTETRSLFNYNIKSKANSIKELFTDMENNRKFKVSEAKESSIKNQRNEFQQLHQTGNNREMEFVVKTEPCSPQKKDMRL